MLARLAAMKASPNAASFASGLSADRAVRSANISALRTCAASCAILVEGDSSSIRFGNIERVLAEPDTTLRLFGKPEVHGKRRMGVSLALGASIDKARAQARAMMETVLKNVTLDK